MLKLSAAIIPVLAVAMVYLNVNNEVFAALVPGAGLEPARP